LRPEGLSPEKFFLSAGYCASPWAGALAKLNRVGIKVHRSVATTVRENLALFGAGNLPVIERQGSCGGHGTSGGCAHEQASETGLRGTAGHPPLIPPE
jgi:hypothetical protein